MAHARETGRAAERMLNLLALLTNSSKPLTLDEIANMMEGQYPVSTPTHNATEARRTQFERDKRVLREMGVVIDMVTLSGRDAGRAAYFIDRSAYGNLYVDITEEELAALQAAAAMVQFEQPWAIDAVHRLGGSSVSAPLPTAAHLPMMHEALPILYNAISERRTAKFRYNNRDRTVHPYGILSRDGHWYLSAFDTGRSEQVNFRLDRLESTVTVGEAGTFDRPDDYRVADAMKADPKLFDGDDEKAVVRIAPSLAHNVAREVGDFNVVARHEDGSIDVVVSCTHRPAFRAWLFAMVDRAVVVSPENIRAEVIGWLRELAPQGGEL